MSRIFLLSPANAGGERARMLLNERARFPLAIELQSGGAPIGAVYSFISGLYFRGKLVYAEAFGRGLVIVPGLGLLPPEHRVTIECMRAIASVPVDANEPRFREPLERDARELARVAPADTSVALLGSIATIKYFEPLLTVFGDRLLFPEEFVGRGDMSRGGLMLRCARAGIEMNYMQAAGAERHGSRPPRLPRLKPGEIWKP